MDAWGIHPFYRLLDVPSIPDWAHALKVTAEKTDVILIENTGKREK